MGVRQLLSSASLRAIRAGVTLATKQKTVNIMLRGNLLLMRYTVGSVHVGPIHTIHAFTFTHTHKLNIAAKLFSEHLTISNAH